MERIENPFPTKRLISPEYFCNRHLETKRMRSALKNGRNCGLFSNRKYGKTGVFSHLFYQNSDQKSANVDLFASQNIKNMANAIGNAVLRVIETQPKKLPGWISSLFSGITPSLSFDSITGKPAVELGIQTVTVAIKTIEEIFKWHKNREVDFGLDEFQQIN